MYNTEEVKPAPTRWGAVFDERRPYKGKVTAYDSPIYIADAALYLMKTQPDLGIENPYALGRRSSSPRRSTCSRSSGARRRVLVGLPQGDPGLQDRRHRHRHHLAGDRQPRPRPTRSRSRRSCPRRVDRLVGHLDDRREGRAPQLRLPVDEPHHLSPEANAQVAEWFGEAPANSKACDQTTEGPTTARPTTPATRPTPTDPVLDHADRAVPRRPHRRQVHDLPGVDPGLDRDQGLTTPATTRPISPDQSAGQAASRPVTAPRQFCWCRPCRVGWSWRTSDRSRRCSSRRSGPPTRSPARSSAR